MDGMDGIGWAVCINGWIDGWDWMDRWLGLDRWMDV